MDQNDYVILLDENGKPYIAHSAVGNAVNRVASAVKNVRGDRQNHKYILKIDEHGRKRYFYTQDEVKAYYEEKRNKAPGAVDKAKEGVKNTVSNANNVVREATGQTSRDHTNKDVAKAVAGTSNNTVLNAKNQFERMKSEFRNKDDKDNVSKFTRDASSAVREGTKEVAQDRLKAAREAYDKSKDNTEFTRDASSAVREGTKEVAQDRLKAAREAYDKTKDRVGSAKLSAQDMINRARTTVKDKAEDLSAKAKSTAQSTKDSVKDIIDNAKKTVQNDSSSQFTKEATNVVREGTKTASRDSVNAARKAFKEYSENDSDFDEKNYSKENHVEDTDFYSFKRKDGKSVILEEDAKWVLPKGVDASNPTIKSALKQIANSGNFKSYDDWLNNANDILGDAIEKVRDKEK